MPKKGRRGGGRGVGRGARGGRSKWQARTQPTEDVFSSRPVDNGEVRNWRQAAAGSSSSASDGDSSDASASDSDDGARGKAWDPEEARTLTVKLAMWEMNQNDTRRDTGSKLCRFGMARRLNVREHFGGIVLSPAASRTVSAADRSLIEAHGIGVVNCSWARLDDVPFTKMKAGGERLLPFLLAANPTKYGQPFTLSSAEALAAALFIAGFAEDARKVMAKFKWSESFWQLNGEYLAQYAACADGAAVIEKQQEVMAALEKAAAARDEAKALAQNDYGSNWGLPSSSEEEDFDDGPSHPTGEHIASEKAESTGCVAQPAAEERNAAGCIEQDAIS